jgi:hypothetical protein
MRYYFILLLFLLSKSAVAQIVDSTFFDWTVHEIKTNELDPKICYITSNPQKTKTDHNSRKQPYIMIARYEDSNSEEFSIYSGFDYKKNSEVFITIDNIQFKILSNQDKAWARTKYEDVKIIETILKSSTLKVRSDSDIGTYAVDEYSLKGVTKAYLRMKKICK